MGKIEFELNELKNRMVSAEQEIAKLKSENKQFQIDNERMLKEIEQLKNHTLSLDNFNKYSNMQSTFIADHFMNLSNIELFTEKNPFENLIKIDIEEKGLCFENKLDENCCFNRDSSLCIKTIDNTNLNDATSKNEKEEEGKSVYKTQTGDRYHKISCKHLERSRIKINLHDALKRKMKPCKVCAPNLFK